ncbi:MAG: OmpA family protein [Planctomycetes bacterium]|nr:OmpA family protein [Planctomycetota bacterium]
MRKKLFLFVCMAIFFLLQAGCFQFSTMDKLPLDTQTRELQIGGYVPKVDGFIIILDSSSSMGNIYRDKIAGRHSRFMIAKDIISRMNNTMPEMEITGNLQRFGYGFLERGKQAESIYGFLESGKQAESVYGPTMYSRSGMEQALRGITSPGGHSPAGLAIGSASEIVGYTEGKNAVILISDGEKLKDDPLMKVKALKNRYGERTCFYTIWVGSKTEGKVFMEKLAAEMGCGLSMTADDVATNETMTAFVREVFLARDSDGDGVPDGSDKCPGTPSGFPVDAEGCAVDSDGDGVSDGADACPDTPGGAIVDNRGCWVVRGVKFEYKKWNVKPEFNSNLNNIIKILRSNPGLKIMVEGHTDNIGSQKYNLVLSEKRAQAIKDYLVENGVGQSRISVTGYGLSRPIADNFTKEGRALNRRAELIPVK